MRLESMICQAMYGNGALIGMELIRLQHQQIIQDLLAAPAAFYGAGASATARASCGWATGTSAAASRLARTAATVSALRGPIKILDFYLFIQLCWTLSIQANLPKSGELLNKTWLYDRLKGAIFSI